MWRGAKRDWGQDGSGTIDSSELGAALRAMGQELTDEDVAKMLAEADDDGGGEIDFNEFCALMGLAPPENKSSSKNEGAEDKAGKGGQRESTASKGNHAVGAGKGKKGAGGDAVSEEKVDPYAILEAEEIDELTELFQTFDEDGGGEISLEELGKMMESLGKKMGMAQLKKMMDSVDADGSGHIDVEEFLTIMAKDKAATDPLQEARKIFDRFDTDGSGAIDAQELYAALNAMGQTVTQDEVFKMLEEADDDGGGEIDFDEFCALMGVGLKSNRKADPEEAERRRKEAEKKREAMEKARAAREKRGGGKGNGAEVDDGLSKRQREKIRKQQADAERKAEEQRVRDENAADWASFLKGPEGTPPELEHVRVPKRYEWTLHRACAEGDIERIEALCLGKGENRAEIDERDDMGWTPLMWAVEGRELDAAAFLVEQGCKVTLKNSDGRTALHMAAADGQARMAGLLLAKHPAAANTGDKYGDTPLLMAVKKGRLDVAEALLLGKADPSHQCTHKDTALHWAAKRGSEEIVRLLLQHKASIKLTDDADTTPGDWARSKHLREVIQPPPVDRRKPSTKAGREQAKRFKQGLQVLSPLLCCVRPWTMR
jgi:calmodulin